MGTMDWEINIVHRISNYLRTDMVFRCLLGTVESLARGGVRFKNASQRIKYLNEAKSPCSCMSFQLAKQLVYVLDLQ